MLIRDLLRQDMAENTMGATVAEASCSNEEGTSSIFDECTPVGKKKRTAGGKTQQVS